MNDEELHGIGEGRRLMMMMATISPLRSPRRTPDLPLDEEQLVAAPPYRKRDKNFSFYFFWDERDLIELELGAGEPCGPHKPANRHQGVVAEPGLVAHWPTP